VKSISLSQPWAWLIVHGPKRIENRRWHLPAKFRGQRVLLHAAKGMTRADYDGAAEMAYDIDPQISLPDRNELDRGKIIGAATFGHCLCPSEGSLPLYRTPIGDDGAPLDLRWWVAWQHGFVVRNVEAFAEPVACKGALGFWEVPIDVLKKLHLPEESP
jgi:hypothetical protein